MSKNNLKSYKSRLLAGLVFVVGLVTMPAAHAQSTSEDSKLTSKAAVTEDDKIGPADVIVVSVTDAPEFGGKYRVSDSGVIEIPGVSTPIHAENLTPTELAHSIREALLDAKQMRDPHVSVFIEEFHGRSVTVLGAVSKPSVYPLTKKTNVLEALSLAGGALPNSGNSVTIVRGKASAESTGTEMGSVQIVRMSDLLGGKESSAEVRNGDVISVSSGQLIYVVGAVVKPGGYAMSDLSSGVSVVQAVALAEGMKSVASHHGLILRQSTSNSARVEIPVDIGQMMTGKAADVVMAPNDILYVPTSGAKQTLQVMGQIAMAAANGAAIYGVGYRVAGIQP
jgi:polysaccharide export outer membrane protein